MIRGSSCAIGRAQQLRRRSEHGVVSDVPEGTTPARCGGRFRVRLIGDVVVSAFFERHKPGRPPPTRARSRTVSSAVAPFTRRSRRPNTAGEGGPLLSSVGGKAWALSNSGHPRFSPFRRSSGSGFHWEVRSSRAGQPGSTRSWQPPFAGKNTISAANRAPASVAPQTHGEVRNGPRRPLLPSCIQSAALGRHLRPDRTNTIAQETRRTGCAGYGSTAAPSTRPGSV